MGVSRGRLWILLLLATVGAGSELAAQTPPEANALGSARSCTRSRTRVVGTVTPVSAASHTFLGRFVGSFARFVQPNAPRMRGDIVVGLGGPGPLAVSFALKRPMAEPLLPMQTEDRLPPSQHRALYAGIKGALAEIRETPGATPLAIALHLEGPC